MYIGAASLILAALLPVAAQETGSVEGRVTASTSPSGVAGATVAAGSKRAYTDSSGAFRLTGLPPGHAALSIEAAGFFKYEIQFRVESSITPRLDVPLVPHSFISGRVLDEDLNPVPGIRLEITQAIRGTGTTVYLWSAATDRDGRYRTSALRPGAYVVMIRPYSKTRVKLDGLGFEEQAPPPPKPRDGERRAWVRSYYPGVFDRRDATRIVLRGGTEASGCDMKLMAAPVYSVRGVVHDDSGKPADATVSLAPAEALELPEVQVKAQDGVFEFPDAPAGDWRVVAEATRGGVKLRGVRPPWSPGATWRM